MALWSQQALHNAAFCPSCFSSRGSVSASPDSRPSCSTFRPAASLRSTASTTRRGTTITDSSRGQRQPGKTGGTLVGCRESLQGLNDRGMSPIFSRCQELLLLQLHAPGCRHPVCQFVRPIQECRSLERFSGKAKGTGDRHPRRHWIGASGMSLQFVQRRSASRGDGSESTSEEGTKGKNKEDDTLAEEQNNEAVQDELEDELEDNMEESVDEHVKLKVNMKERSYRWRGWWPFRGQNEIEDVADRVEEEQLENIEDEGTGEAQGSEPSKGEGKRKRQAAESWEVQEDGGDVDTAAEAAPSEKIIQNEEEKVGFWRWLIFWKQQAGDDPLGPEDELLVRDLESLTFNWKDLLDPTLENVLALGFTVLLSVALFKIAFQLLVVVMTILLSALKYTVLAAVLVGLLIFLL